MGSHARLAAEVADIFRRWRDGKFRDDSGLVGVVSAFLRGWIVPVGDAIPDRHKCGGGRRQAALGETHSQAALGNDRGGRQGGLYAR